MCPKTFHSRHTAHGIKYEPVAIDRYHKYTHSEKTPVHVFKSGFVVILQFWGALQMER